MTAASPRAWQRMLSGRRLDLLDPRPEDIAIEDIAHGLARVARWNGQTLGDHIFSVAQHSLLVERLFRQANPERTASCLAALLHDAAEYVVGDLISPFKSALGEGYKQVEHRVLDAVFLRFGIAMSEAEQDRIKVADRAAARHEAVVLAGFAEAEASLFFGEPAARPEPLDDLTTPLAPSIVQALFLERFDALWPGSR